MKTIANMIAAAALGSAAPAAAQATETRETTKVEERADGSVRETRTTTTTTFSPEARTKVVKYFEPYRTERYGLPPTWVSRVKVKEMPVKWRTTRISPGVVIAEKERDFLLAAPPELVKVLPEPASEVRYYVAGGNIVAVDKSYKVVDSIQIPSVKITVDD